MIFGKGPPQQIENTTMTGKKENITNFSAQQKKFSLVLHFNGANSLLENNLFVNGVGIYKYKAKKGNKFSSVMFGLCFKRFF